MISSGDTDLMGWNSPSNNSTTAAKNSTLTKPLLPTINGQSSCTIDNPFDAICDTLNNGGIQNPFDDICSLVCQQTAKQCQNEENEINLLNLTIFTAVKEDVPNTKLANSNSSTLSDDDILNISSLDDELCDLNDDAGDNNLIDELQCMDLTDSVTRRVNNNTYKNCLSQSQCEFRQMNSSSVSVTDDPNSSLDQIKHRSLPTHSDSSCEEGLCYHELCSKLESSFNRSKSLFEKIKNDDKKIVATFKRRSAEFCNKIEREEEQKIEPATPGVLQTKSMLLLQPLESPQLKLRSTSNLQRKDENACGTNGTKSRQGPMKAMAPLKSMIKSSNARPDKVDTKDSQCKQQAATSTTLYKSSYHKSPVKKLVLKSKSSSSVPPLACSTPEKHSNLSSRGSSTPDKAASSSLPRHSSFSTTSPLRTIPSPLKSSFLSNMMVGGGGGCVKTLTSPMKGSSTSLGGGMKSLTSPLKVSTLGSGIRAPSPLKTTSSNVLGGGSAKSNLLTSESIKPRSSSLSRLRPPRASSKLRFNFSQEEKENISAQYVL